MKLLLSLFVIFHITPLCLAQDRTQQSNQAKVIKESIETLSLQPCEYFDIADKAFNHVFEETLNKKKIKHAHISSAFMQHGNTASWFTTVRLESRRGDTLFFCVTRHHQSFDANNLSDSKWQFVKAFRKCFEKSLKKWSYKKTSSKKTLSAREIDSWIQNECEIDSFSKHLSRLILIDRLADTIPTEQANQCKAYFSIKTYSEEQQKKTKWMLPIPPGVYIAQAGLKFHFEQQMRVRAGNSQYKPEKNTNPELETTIFATTRLCENVLKQFQ